MVLDADLSKSTKTADFKAVCEERFFNMGIAEANMMGVAAGLSTCGKIPFVSTFAMFAAGRAFEQIRNSICYPKFKCKDMCNSCRLNCRRRWSISSSNRGFIINEKYS